MSLSIKTWCHLHSKFETLESGDNSSRDREGNIKIIMQGLDVNSMMQAELTISSTFYVWTGNITSHVKIMPLSLLKH